MLKMLPWHTWLTATGGGVFSFAAGNSCAFFNGFFMYCRKTGLSTRPVSQRRLTGLVDKPVSLEKLFWDA